MDYSQKYMQHKRGKRNGRTRLLLSDSNMLSIDVTSFLSTIEELKRMKHEMPMMSDANNQALSHVDDATKIAEIHAEKVELLSAELCRVKALLDSNVELKSNESTELMKELKSEVKFLKEELEKANAAEKRATKAEALIQQLK